VSARRPDAPHATPSLGGVRRVSDLSLVLAERGYRRLLATRLTSQATDGLLQAGLASYVLFSPERQATGPKVAASFAVLLLPYSLVGPFAGVLIDRWRRRQILFGANLVRAGLAALLAVLVANSSQSWLFVALALAALGVARFLLATLSAALPHVVDGRRLVTGNAVATTSGTVATALGAGLGFGARLLFGGSDLTASLIVLGGAVGYLCAAGLALRMGRDQLGPDPENGHDNRAQRLDVSNELRSLREGAVYLWQRVYPRNALLALGSVRIVVGLMTVMVVLLERASFHLPSDTDGGLRGVGVTGAALAIGIPIGAAVTPAAVRRWGEGRWIPGVLILTGALLVALALPFLPMPVVALGFLLGAGGQAVKVSVDSIVQHWVDDQHRGLVFALYDVLFNVAFVAAVAVAGYTLPSDGRSVVMVLVAGGLLAGAGFWYASVTPRRLPEPTPARS
jgi:MFS family permease